MSSENQKIFTKDNLDLYLNELAKEYRKRNRHAPPAEIILIGGAAILANYGFREMTTDVDAIIQAASSMKDAINYVGDKYGLPNSWLNSDFTKTSSYSPKLKEISVYYKKFSHILEVRTIESKYLIAMKLRSGRKYKNDLSDIIGILAEHEKRNKPILLSDINDAVNKLYGGWDGFSKDSKKFIEDTIQNGNYEQIYTSTNEIEKNTRNILIEFEQDYPNVVNGLNVDDILKQITKSE